MLKSSETIILTVSLLLISGCARNQGGNSNTLQIKGSDTMVNLGQAWAEEYMNKNPETFVAVTGGGSGTGISALVNGTCNIAEVSREMKDREIKLVESKGSTPVKHIVALDGLVVVVNPANKISELTLDQLADIYTGKIRNWKELGGHDAEIVLLSREVNSGTHVYFKEHVLQHGRSDNKEEFSPEALLLSSSHAIVDEIKQNQDAIGYYGMGYVTAEDKTLKIAKDKNSPAVPPTMENIIDGSYPISRPLLMYTRGEPSGLVKLFLDYILSPEGQDIVKKLDFVPVK
ncbi:MAG: phosphate ABC transporter substrate-binding protein [Bacteroidetes bacterium]|nr:phosphate ABC transporter substrate-binding protein [Bacteroidota bacterium]